MFSGVVRCAISTVLKKKAMLDSTRVKDYKNLGREILEKIALGEAQVTTFDNKFSTTLLCILSDAFDNTRIYRSLTKRQKLWSDFHQLRVK